MKRYDYTIGTFSIVATVVFLIGIGYVWGRFDGESSMVQFRNEGVATQKFELENSEITILELPRPERVIIHKDALGSTYFRINDRGRISEVRIHNVGDEPKQFIFKPIHKGMHYDVILVDERMPEAADMQKKVDQILASTVIGRLQ